MAGMKSFRHKKTRVITEMPEHLGDLYSDVLECVEPCEQVCESCKIEVDEPKHKKEEGNRGK